MDQGYQQVPRRVASGYFSLIFFIVLCLALIGGYIPLVLYLQQSTQDLGTLNNLIETKLVEPLRARQVVLQTETPVEGSTLIYGNAFFEKVAELALEGTRFEEIFRLSGWPTKESVEKDIQDKLDATNQPHLKKLIETLESESANLKSQVQTLNQNLAEARRERDQNIAALTAARKEFTTKIETLQNRLDQVQADATKQVEEYKKKWAQANEERKQIWDQKLQSEREAAAKIADLEKTISEREKEIAELRRELQGRKVVVQAGPRATVLRTDLIHKFVIVDQGARDDLKVNTTLLVYRKVRRGELMPIGKVIVVVVDPITSRADITEQDDANPIMPGDLLYLKPPEQ